MINKKPLNKYMVNKRQEALIEAYIEQETLEEVQDKEIALEEAQVLENYEISMSYVHKGYKWD